MIVRYRAQALADIDEIDRYLRERSPTGALNVLRAINSSIDKIAAWPLANPRTQDPDIRVKLETRYRYKIFYRVMEDAVVILHVRHRARQPWP